MDNSDQDKQPPAPSSAQESADSVVLEEEIDPNYVPSESEVVEYAKWLGMDLDKDNNLFWIAREGLMAPLPKDWKPCRTKDTDDIYYFNFTTGESTWDHPCDGYYKRLYEEEKKKKEIEIKENSDQKRSKAKQDVEQLLGKSDKKNKKKKKAADMPLASSGDSLKSFERAPLPGLSLRNPLPDIRLSASTNSLTSQLDADGEVPSRTSQPAPLSDPMRTRLGPAKLSLLPTPLTREAEAKVDVRGNMTNESTSKKDDKTLSAKPTVAVSSQPLNDTVHRGDIAESKTDAESRASLKPSVSPVLTQSSSLRLVDSVGRPRSRSSSPVSALRGEVASSSSYQFNNDADSTANEQKRSTDHVSLESKDSSIESGRSGRTSSASPLPGGIASLQTPENVGSRASRSGGGGNTNHYSNNNTSSAASSPSRASATAVTPAELLATSAGSDRVKQLEAEIDKLNARNNVLLENAEENNSQISSLQSLTTTMKNEIANWEKKYENNHADWKAKFFAAEAEKDRIDSERRQLKLNLMDLELQLGGKTSLEVADGSSEVSALSEENKRLKLSVAEARDELEQSKIELRRFREQNTQQTLEIGRLKVECQEAQIALHDSQQSLSEKRLADRDSGKYSQGLAEMEDTTRELQSCRGQLSDALQRLQVMKDSMSSLETSMQRRCDILGAENAALGEKLEVATRRLSSEAAEVSAHKSELACAKTTRNELEEKLAQLAAESTRAHRIEQSLRSEILVLTAELGSTREKLSTSENGTATAAAAAPSASATAHDLSEAHAKQISDLNRNLSTLEGEKVSLMVQLSRKETELQHAKDELNSTAKYMERNRQLELEKKSLEGDRKKFEVALSRQQSAELELRDKYEISVREMREEAEKVQQLTAANRDLTAQCEEERTTNIQKDKKIRSYQEELLQLQKRVIELNAAAASSPKSADFKDESSLIADLKSSIHAKEQEIDLLKLKSGELSRVAADQNHELERVKSENSRLSSAVSALEQTLATTELNAESNNIADTSRADVEELLQLRRARDEADRSRSAVGVQLEDLKRMLAKQEAELKVLRSTNERLRNDNIELQLKWEAAENKATDATLANTHAAKGTDIEMESMRKQLEYLKKHEMDKAKELGDTYNAKFAAERECRQLNSDLSAARSSILLLEEEVTKLREKVTQLPKDNALTASERRRLEAELEEAKRKIHALEEQQRNNQSGPTALRVGKEDEAGSAPLMYTSDRTIQDDSRAPTLSTREAAIGGIALAGYQSGGSTHLVELSILVGRQQGAMMRLEEQLRAAEARIASLASAKSEGEFVPKDAGGAEYVTATRDDGRAASPTLLSLQRSESAAFATESGSDSSVHMYQFVKDKKPKLSPNRVVKFKRNTENVDEEPLESLSVPLQERVSSALSRSGLHLPSGKDSLHRTINGQIFDGFEQRISVDLQTLLKREHRLLRELQQLCSSSKRSIKSDQAHIRNIKMQWKNKDRTNRLTAQQINSLTNRVNAQVDTLRTLHNFVHERERKLDSLGKTVKYFDSCISDTLPAAADGFLTVKSVDTKRLKDLLVIVHQKREDLKSHLKTLLNYLEVGDGFESGVVDENDCAQINVSTPTMSIQHLAHQAEVERFPPGKVAGGELSRSSIPSRDPPRYSLSMDSNFHPQQLIVDPRIKSQLLQDQIQKIVARQSQSRHVCDNHAGWLDSLRREIGSFPSHPIQGSSIDK